MIIKIEVRIKKCFIYIFINKFRQKNIKSNDTQPGSDIRAIWIKIIDFFYNIYMYIYISDAKWPSFLCQVISYNQMTRNLLSIVRQLTSKMTWSLFRTISYKIIFWAMLNAWAIAIVHKLQIASLNITIDFFFFFHKNF